MRPERTPTHGGAVSDCLATPDVVGCSGLRDLVRHRVAPQFEASGPKPDAGRGTDLGTQALRLATQELSETPHSEEPQCTGGCPKFPWAKKSSACSQGIFAIDDVSAAVLEPSGKLSVLKAEVGRDVEDSH